MAAFLALTGFMGSGKSSVGAAVAARLGWRFVDLDEEFVRRGNGPIADFFAAQGEPAFRAKECELLAEVLAQEGQTGLVVALGGGTLESLKAVEMLSGRRGTVLLDVQPGEAWARVEASGRPLAGDPHSFRALWEQRRETYDRCADWVLPVRGRSVDDLARDVIEIVETAGERWGTVWGRRLSATQRSSLIIGGGGALAVLEGQARSIREAGSRLYMITDLNVMHAWGERVRSLLGQKGSDDLWVVEPGEGSKTVSTLEQCWSWLAERGARRDDVLVALGGGVVGDLGGFAAATYQRGISLWQIPTSVLAQVDSSVGGKTAVNLAAGKNLVGAFYQPDLVVIDPETLQTLPEREYSNGLGEVVKHALLMSPESLDRLEADAKAVMARDIRAVGRISKANVAFKASVVQDDERERGRRAILNLGHTTAHALEVTGGYGALGHGQAVALGLLVSLAVSEALLGLDTSVRARTSSLLREFGLPTVASLPPAETLFVAMAHDKKATAGSTGFVGLRAMGDPVWGLDVPEGVLIEALGVIKE